MTIRLNKTEPFIDMQTAKYVEVYQDHTGKLWVNVNERCVLRIGKAEKLVMRKDRNRKTK